MAIRYLLDTNICIYIAKHNPPSVRVRFEQVPSGELALSVVTLGELRFGAEKSQRREAALGVIQALTQRVTVAPLAPEAGLHYGEVRAHLQKQGLVIGNNDLWLAAHARSQGWTLVTNNEREFVRVPGLAVENWV